ncbi:hypothetical protein [Megalodesulfovibrio paquesii]
MSALQVARQHWSPLPPWVETLAKACDAESQAAVAKQLGVSPAQVSTALRSKYPGDLVGLEAKVWRVLGGDVVNCPVLGEIEGATCLEHQRRPLAATSGFRVRLHRACQACPQRIVNGS